MALLSATYIIGSGKKLSLILFYYLRDRSELLDLLARRGISLAPGTP